MEPEAAGWRETATTQLHHVGFSVFNPATAFSLENPDKHVSKCVLEINGWALDSCDAVLANLSGPSIGTPIEVDRVVHSDAKVVACFGGDDRSLYVKTWPHYATMTEAIGALMKEFADGS